mgnify:CR=1 FL=1
MINKEGSGWRLAWDPSKKQFPVLLGGEGWAFELSDREWKSFVKLVLDLIKEHKQINSQLMTGESISLELDRGLWWGCLDGDQKDWALQVVLQPQEALTRGIEVSWPIPIAKDFVDGMRIVWDSYK